MASLASVFDALVPEGDAFAIEAPAAWGQGRTLYGGMTAALCYEAARRGFEGLGPLRSAQFTFVGPASGRLGLRPALLRRGRSSQLIAVDCLNAEGMAARAMFVFGGARESKIAHDYLAAPAIAPAEACEPFRKDDGGGPRGFWENFETRITAGGRLFKLETPRPEFSVWTRFRDPGPVDPVTALLAMADALPPAAMVHFPEPAPISSVTWAVDLTNIPESAAGWRLLHAASEHAADGYSMQAMMLWDEHGAPLAIGRQAVAIFI